MPRDWMDYERDRLIAEADRLSAAQRQEWADKVARIPDDDRAPTMLGWVLIALVVAGAWMAGPVILAWMLSWN